MLTAIAATNCNSRPEYNRHIGGITIHVTQFTDLIKKLISRNKKPRIVLSLADIDYVSSATLGIFLNIRKHIDAAEGQVRISNLTPPVQEIFHVTGLVRRFDIHDDDATALASFSD